jgi:hypothetical protein
MLAFLAREDTARKFADELMKVVKKEWEGARIFLGQLRSNDLKKLGVERQEAIRAFWTQLFRAGGAAEVMFAHRWPRGISQIYELGSLVGKTDTRKPLCC